MIKALAAGILLGALIYSPNAPSRGPNPPVDASLIKGPRLINAIIRVESSGDPRAVSKCGAQGLMQVRWKIWGPTLRKEGIAKRKADLFDPETNVRAGRYILAHYLRKHRGDLRKALHAYSGGARGYYRKVMEAQR